MMRPQIIERLSGIRGTIRRRLIAYGFCAVLAGGVAAFLAIVMVDWLVELPAALRIVFASLYLAGISAAIVHWIVRPLRARLELSEVAARLEAHFGTLEDRLTSTVDFIERGDAGSAGMMQEVIANTERIVGRTPLESALTLRPLALRGAMMGVGAVVLIMILLTSPGWARTGLYRYVYPLGELEWPHDVFILPLTADQVVAVGESVTVRMGVQRGLHDALRCVVHLRELSGDKTSLTMRRDPDGSFSATIDAVTEDMVYWFEAGDDDTSGHSYRIRVVRRPEVVEAIATVYPPPYASTRSVRVQDLSDGPIRAPISGRVRIALQAGKPIPPDPTGTQVGLRIKSGELIPLVVDPAAPDRLSVELSIDADVRFRIELRDENGFENRGAAEYSIVATPDTPPGVIVVEPRGVTEVTPKGSVRLVARVEDDFGIASVEIEAEPASGGRPLIVPLTDRFEILRQGHGVEGVVRYLWDLTSLALSPGEMLLYSVVATDNYTDDHTDNHTEDNTDKHMDDRGGGQVGRSSTMRINIISEIEFDIRLRADLAQLESRMRQAALDQTGLLDRTTSLVQSAETAQRLSDPSREIITMLAGRQARLARRVGQLGDRVDKLVDRILLSGAGDEEARRRITALGEALHRTSRGAMTAASIALEETREEVEATEQRQNLQEAQRLEEAALEQLQTLIRSMSQWGSFQEVVTKTRDLLERQLDLRNRTAQLGKSMLGKSVESLSPEEAAGLKRMTRRQEQLTTDIEQLLGRMKRLTDTSRDKDESGADALDAALRTARGVGLVQSARAAAEAIDSNRTAAATIDQKAAADALKEMTSALQERERHALEQLRKRLEEVRQQVAVLIEQQQSIRGATHEASLMETPAEAMMDFEAAQRTIKRNTRVLGEELAQVESAAPVSRFIRQAASPMGEAEAHLRDRQPDAAVVNQDQALALLDDALTALAQAEDDAAKEALRRSLNQIRDDLEEILAVQLEVNGGIGGLLENVAKRGRIGRVEARMASKLARLQTEARSLITAQLPDFQKIVVYLWALQRVAKWMDTSRDRLDGRDIDETLVSSTDRIVHELTKLIKAIDDTKSLPLDTEFVETESGGGQGKEGAQAGAPVPTVAELLVLKAMQIDIHERTGQLHESVDGARATEAGLRELELLGEDQAEVQRLTKLVTQRVRHP